jgi:membrane protease YdiL (CAAX protease family)
MDDAGTQGEETSVEGLAGGESSRRGRFVWLLGVCFVAFAYPLLNSTLYFLYGQGAHQRSLTPGQLSFWFYVAILGELVALLVLLVALRRQGRSLRDLTLSFSWKDLPESLLLAIGSYIVFIQVSLLLFYGYYVFTGRSLDATPQNIEHLKAKITLAAVLLMLVNPFYEEIIARAYVITEVRFLTGSRVIAVLVSVVLQSAYHLYQGTISALLIAVTFTVFSIYFVMRGKILPVILAHMYFDFLALLSYAQQ